MLRYLRISTAVFFAILCMANAVMLVRGYWYFDAFWSSSLHTRWFMEVETRPGQATIFSSPDHVIEENKWRNFTQVYPLRRHPIEAEKPWPSLLGFRWIRTDDLFIATVPLWYPAILSGALSFILAAQIYRRFSLRAMMIAATLLCVVLGLAVATSQ